MILPEQSITFWAYIAGRLKRCNLHLLVSPSLSDLVVQSCRFDEFVGNREIYNLSMVSRPVLLQIKEIIGISYIEGVKQLKTTKQFNEVGQFVVHRVLNDTKKSARPALIFLRMLGLNNLEKKTGRIKMSPGFPQNGQNPRTSGWAPFVNWR